MLKQLESFMSDKLKTNIMLKVFSLTKVPLLFATGAHVQDISDSSCNISMPFHKIVKNHLGSLYFGALAIGADACIGMLAAYKIEESGEPVRLVFKSFKANFLKRAEGPTQFICDEGDKIDTLLEQALSSKERVHDMILARAECQGEVVAEFQLELSLKLKQ